MAWAGTPVQASGAIPMMNAAGTTAINTAANYRQGLFGAMLGPAPGGPMVWRSGVLPTSVSSGATMNGDLVVAQTATASSSVLVAPGNAVLYRTGASGGPYVATFTGTSTLVADPASSTNPRVDVVAMQLVDAAIGDSGTQGAQLFIVNGTPSSSPVAPAVPTGAIILTLIFRATSVNTITNANFIDSRKSACTYGGVRCLLPGDLSTDPGSYIGEHTFDAVTSFHSGLRYWDGTTWRGVKPYTASSVWANGTSNILITTSHTAIASATIPDPGYPYQVRATGQIDFSTYPTFTAGAAPYVQGGLMLDSVSPATPIAQANGFAQSASGAADGWTQIPTKTSGALTGAHTVYLVGWVGGMINCNCVYTGWTSNATYLDVEIIPT